MQIVYESPNEFRKNAKGKKIFFYGAGSVAGYYLNTMCKELDVVAIVDRDEKKWGTAYETAGKLYPIVSLKRAIEEITLGDIERYILFITPTFQGGEIVQELNAVWELRNVKCYLAAMLRDWYEPQKVMYTAGDAVIPRKIHYIWAGGAEMPDMLKRCIASWYQYCPDFKIIRWDEKNYDFTKCQYMKEAYEAKKWGFVSDYARLDIVYREGGIYFDTDVELLKPIDKLLCDNAFFGFAANYCINTGGGFGAVKKHPFVKELRNGYHNQKFIDRDGKFNLKTCYEYQNPIFMENGFSLENVYQKKDGVVLYPSEVFSPKGIMNFTECFTENTYAVHHGSLSWVNKRQRDAMLCYVKQLREMLSRG